MNQKLHLNPALLETIADASSSAETKCRLNFGQGLALGVIAAAYLALATTLAFAVSASITSPSVQKLVMGAVFPVGLIAIVMAVAELSTGNYLTTPLGAMTSCVRWRHVLSNWAVSYAGNFLGSFLLAAIIIKGANVFTGAGWGQEWVNMVSKVATTKASLSAMEAFWRGFLCIWLVDLAVWQAYRVKEPAAKFLLIWFPTFAFFALGLEHSVVNMFLFPAAIFAGASITWTQFLVNNLVPVVLGNVVGGMFVVGMLYWFSGGLPVLQPSTAGGGNPSGRTAGAGSYALLGVNALKGLALAAVFLGLFPAAAAALALLLPQSAGILIPIAVAAYLSVIAFAVSASRGGEQPHPAGQQPPEEDATPVEAA
ncbi:MAG: formate/nitrite transporter family protein [Chloroflexi bacterium]|nr:formate/nitrite transporter family protein [Chloroflexota bacterium]